MAIPETNERSIWRRAKMANSLPEVFSTIEIPQNAGFWKKLPAFSGPGLTVAVGYMDPVKWATDIAGGSQNGYTLLSVILVYKLVCHYPAISAD